MSYLQDGHVEQSFYERASKSYLANATATYITESGTKFLADSTASFLVNMPQNNKSFMESSNQSFIKFADKQYLMADVKDTENHLEIDNVHHVEEDTAHHVEEDTVQHLEVSDGESSDDANEDFSHAVDWGLILPPFFSKVEVQGTTRFYCKLTQDVHDRRPMIPERFDVFDFTKQQLMETVARYHVAKGGDSQNGLAKYKALKAKEADLHNTELQSQALENLRVWKHKKEQELLGQINIQNADYSDRKDRMGVGDASSHGASERKRRRQLLKQKQEEQRRQQQQEKNEQRRQQLLKQQEELQMKQAMAASRQQGKQSAAQRSAERKRQQELQRKRQRDQQQDAQMQYVKVGQKQQAAGRQQGRQDAMSYELEQKYNDQAQSRANVSSQRDQKVAEQQRKQAERARQKKEREEQLEREAQRQRDEQLRKSDQKRFIKRINMLLTQKSCGILFEDLPNEFFLKYNTEWNPGALFGIDDLDTILKMVPDTITLRGGMTKRVLDRKHYQKIRIISDETNDILTVLSISESIEDAMLQLRQMVNQKENARQQQLEQQRRREQERRQREEEEKRRREQEERRKKEEAWKAAQTPSGFQPGRIDYSRANNWGLPAGFRVNKTAQGRLFFINDNTRQTQWIDPRPLPPGWRGGKTPQGRAFYIDDNTKKTSWNDPRPRIQI